MKVFLFDPSCMSYRIHIYKYFIEQFKKSGYDLTIYYDKNSRKDNINEPRFIGIEYSFSSFKSIHLEKSPDVSIHYIWLSYKFSIPFLVYSKLFLTTKSIVWSKGINITNIKQPFKNQLYYLRQRLADSLILYSDFERQFIKTKKNKVFVGYNTINQYVYDLENLKISKETLKRKWGINHTKTLLFVGRMEKRKKIQLLLNAFSKSLCDYGLILVGPGLTDTQKQLVDKADNIYYLNAIYDINKLSELYSCADIFSIPGHIGLGVNEAFLFNLPVITQDMDTDPKLVSSEPKMLFIDGVNGLFFSGTEEDLVRKITLLFDNDELRDELGKNAKKTFEEKAKIEYMRDGFLKSINFVLNK